MSEYYTIVLKLDALPARTEKYIELLESLPGHYVTALAWGHCITESIELRDQLTEARNGQA